MTLIFDAVHNFHQPENGYRFSVDSLMLAEFVSSNRAERVLDLGAGCGVVGLASLEKSQVRAAKNMYFVELQEELSSSLAKNIALYQKRTSTKLHQIKADWRQLTKDSFQGPIDYIMVNPPYFPRSSRISKNKQRAQARHELNGDLAELCQIFPRLLKKGGKAALIFPAERLPELFQTLKKQQMVPRKLRLIYAKPHGPATLLLMESEFISN